MLYSLFCARWQMIMLIKMYPCQIIFLLHFMEIISSDVFITEIYAN